MRVLTIQKTVFTFAELSESAKETARNWIRETNELDHDCVYSDAAEIADLFGLDLKQKRVPLMSGGNRYDPAIYYSGFCSQGDGACFEGSYQYKKGALKAVKAHAPNDTELHSIVERLQNAQRRVFYSAYASCEHTGRYSNSGNMSVSVDTEKRCDNSTFSDIESDITQALRDFADWIYSRLESEWDWINSDEQTDETLIANEYEFDESGNVA